MRSRYTVMVLALTGILAGVVPAAAHEERSLHALTVLGSVEPAVPGVEVRVVHLGAPALAVHNDTGSTLKVLDGHGRPFLRIGSAGVFANAESAMAYRSIDPASDAIPSGLGGKARWARIGRHATWSWFDPRLTYGAGAAQWRITMSVGGRELVASGGFEPLEAHGHFETQLDAPHVEGLAVRIAEGPVPALFVRNDTDDTLHVTGPAGEAFLKVGPNGVFANVRSPSFYTSALQTIRRVPASADPSAAPRWKRVSDVPVWAWLERRAATPASALERDALGSTRAPVLEWTSPMRLGAVDLDVAGRLVWVPPHHISEASASGSREATYWWLVAVVLAGGLVLAVRRGRLTPA